MILGWLSENPDQEVVAADDQQAVAWIRELQLERDFPAASKTMPYVFGYAQHPTHWIVAGVLHQGKENHILWCFPKSRYSPAQIQGMIGSAGSLDFLKKIRGEN